MRARYPFRVVIHNEVKTYGLRVGQQTLNDLLAQRGVTPEKWHLVELAHNFDLDYVWYAYPNGWQGAGWTPEHDRLWRALEVQHEAEERKHRKGTISKPLRISIPPVTLVGQGRSRTL